MMLVTFIAGDTMAPMFQCKKCSTTDFKLMLQPSFEGSVTVEHNDHDEVVIKVNEKDFIADLMFMNQFAFCTQCDSTGAWDYYFPRQKQESES
jgi:hypothetical protein